MVLSGWEMMAVFCIYNVESICSLVIREAVLGINLCYKYHKYEALTTIILFCGINKGRKIIQKNKTVKIK